MNKEEKERQEGINVRGGRKGKEDILVVGKGLKRKKHFSEKGDKMNKELDKREI